MRTDFVTKALPAANVIATGTGLLPFLLAQPIINPTISTNTLQPAILSVPGTGRLEQRKFQILASGFANCAADCTLTINIYGGISAVAANNTLLASSGAVALTLAGVGKPWWVILDLIFDSVAGNLCGTRTAQVGQTPVAAAAIPNQLTALNAATEPVFQLTAFAQFSVANVASYCTLADFGLSV